MARAAPARVHSMDKGPSTKSPCTHSERGRMVGGSWSCSLPGYEVQATGVSRFGVGTIGIARRYLRERDDVEHGVVLPDVHQSLNAVQSRIIRRIEAEDDPAYRSEPAIQSAGLTREPADGGACEGNLPTPQHGTLITTVIALLGQVRPDNHSHCFDRIRLHGNRNRPGIRAAVRTLHLCVPRAAQ